LRIVPLQTLAHILLLILDTIVIHSLPHGAVRLFILFDSLSAEHEIPQEITKQVVDWFGVVDSAKGTWKVDVEAIVKHIGLSILSGHKVRYSLLLSRDSFTD
jgi:sister chromatid cohesion protein DCC1